MAQKVDFENLKDLVYSTRSTRRFKQDVEVKYDDLVQVIDLARVASSGKNMQPLKYIIITDKYQNEEIYKPLVWAAHLQDWDQSEDEKPSAYILILNDTNIDGITMIDLGIALQSIMLGLKAKGLDSCPLASIDKQSYKKLFNLKDNLDPMLIVAIGTSSEKITLVDATDDTNYYRDEKQDHFVPKRVLEDIIITADN
jgi:nitroreductase